MDDWSINIMIELFSTIREGYGSETTEAVEDITGRRPISMTELANEYLDKMYKIRQVLL